MTDPPINDPHLLSEYRSTLTRVEGKIGVTGVDIGFDTVHPRGTEDLRVRVHGTSEFWSTEFSNFLPDTITRITATYALERAPLSGPLQGALRAALPPLQPGISVGNVGRTGGTIGLIVSHPSKGLCILSCAHVLVDERPGGKPIIVQPAGSDKDDQIATAEDSFVDGDGDAAIGVLTGMRKVQSEQLITGVIVTGSRMPQIGEMVEKSGAGTQRTAGRVDGAGRYFLHSPDGKAIGGMDGFRIVPVGKPHPDDVSGPGDSGSTWYGRDDHVGVGLHVAGEPPGDPDEHGIACYLVRVLTRLQVAPAVAQSFSGQLPPAEAAEHFAPAGGGILARLVESVAPLTRLVKQLITGHGDNP